MRDETGEGGRGERESEGERENVTLALGAVELVRMTLHTFCEA